MKEIWERFLHPEAGSVFDSVGLLLFCAVVFFGAWALRDISDEQQVFLDGSVASCQLQMKENQVMAKSPAVKTRSTAERAPKAAAPAPAPHTKKK